MSQKSFEDIENKIREAAANSEPAFDEQAWLKMELLLNKEGRKKRRFFIWWRYGLPILLMGLGLVGYWYFNNASVVRNKPEIATAATSTATKNEHNVTRSNKVELNVEKKNSTSHDKENIASGDAIVESKNVKGLSKKTSGELKEVVIQQQDAKDDRLPDAKTFKAKKLSVKHKGASAIKISGGEVSTETDATLSSNEILKDNDNMIEKKEPITSPVKENNDLIVEKNVTDTVKSYIAIKEAQPTKADKDLIISDSKSVKKSSSAKGLSKWYLLATIGAEASGVKFLSFPNSPVTPRYGAGVGFQINKRISVQTGFYAGRKKYIGGPGDYHPKPGSYWGMVDIKKVDASCLIYDIPVTLRYNFVQKSALIFYGTAGVSSFIMKKEDYRYHYNYNNYYYISDKSYTGNKNLFSMLIISAGLEKKLGAQFSFLAEPYLSFPLSGVGEGSVKLYSAGLQIGLKYSPSFK